MLLAVRRVLKKWRSIGNAISSSQINNTVFGNLVHSWLPPDSQARQYQRYTRPFPLDSLKLPNNQRLSRKHRHVHPHVDSPQPCASAPHNNLQLEKLASLLILAESAAPGSPGAHNINKPNYRNKQKNVVIILCSVKLTVLCPAHKRNLKEWQTHTVLNRHNVPADGSNFHFFIPLCLFLPSWVSPAISHHPSPRPLLGGGRGEWILGSCFSFPFSSLPSTDHSEIHRHTLADSVSLCRVPAPLDFARNSTSQSQAQMADMVFEVGTFAQALDQDNEISCCFPKSALFGTWMFSTRFFVVCMQ